MSDEAGGEAAPRWPSGVRVGNGRADVSIGDARMTPAEARLVAAEILLRADAVDRLPDTRFVDGVPRRADEDEERAS